MKKIILLLVAIVIAWFVGCVKEPEMPPLEFKFAVDSSNESFADKGVNESVNLPLEVKADYDFSKVPMKYKVETDKNASISIGGEVVQPNEVYTLENPNLVLSYVGKAAGQHNVRVTFFNGKTKKDHVTKEFKLKFIEYDYALEELSGKHTVFQGERTNFDFRLTPKNNEDDKNYTIIFKSYDEADIKLERNKIFFNGEGITFNKVYSIADLSKFTVSVLPFHVGNKELKYVIKNKTGKREGVISLEVKKNTLEVSGELDKTPVGLAGEVVNFVATINKSPLHIRKVWYKTSLSQGTPGGIEISDWKEVSYEGNSFKVPIKILKNGSYQYKLEFKDEFGNVVEKIIGINSVANYNFKVEVEGRNNAYQGETVSYKIKVVKEDPRFAATYKIVFDNSVEGDVGDISNKTFIQIEGGERTNGNEYKIGEINSVPIINVKLTAKTEGVKKLKYKVYRYSAEGNSSEVSGYVILNVQKNEFKIEEDNFDKSLVLNSNDVINYTAKITRTNIVGRDKIVKYKIVVIEGDKRGIEKENEWINTTLPNDNILKVPFKFVTKGVYKIQFFLQDEFGNESLGRKQSITYRDREVFSASLSSDKERILNGEKFNFRLNIRTNNVHYSDVKYYFYINQKVSYKNKLYSPNEKILIEDINDLSMTIFPAFLDFSYPRTEGEGLYWTFLVSENKFNGSYSGKIVNTDGIEGNFNYILGENSGNVEIVKCPNVIHPFSIGSIDVSHVYGYYEKLNHYSDFGYRFTEYKSNERLSVKFDSFYFDRNFLNVEDFTLKVYLKTKSDNQYEEVGNVPLSSVLNREKYVMIQDRGFRKEDRRGFSVEEGNRIQPRKYSSLMKIEVYYKGKIVYKAQDININTIEGKGNEKEVYIDSSYYRKWIYERMPDELKSISIPKEKEIFYYENYLK